MKIETYRDQLGEHRWRMRAANGQIIATSGEGYTTKGKMHATISMLRSGFPFAQVIEVDDE